jgi:hypothetical protein
LINLAVREAVDHYNEEKRDWNFDVLVLGAYNIRAALAEAVRKDAKGRADVLMALRPMSDLLDAAKPFIVKRDRSVASSTTSPSSKPGTSFRSKGYMTCQCCARAVKAERGPIADHGYRRPFGRFGRTALCTGSNYAPFEASRDRLGELIADLERKQTKDLAELAEVENERRPVTLRFPDPLKPLDAGGRRQTKFIEMTRENAADSLSQLMLNGRGPISFDDAKAQEVEKRRGQIERLREHIATLKARHEAWVPTHNSSAPGWVPVTSPVE